MRTFLVLYMPLRVLMFGWEFPPETSGGLGVASRGLAHALDAIGVGITFVLPRRQRVASHLRFVFAHALPPGVAYGAYGASGRCREGAEECAPFPLDYLSAAKHYARFAAAIARREPHDVIHAHDWLSFLAGLEAKRASGKPLIVHVHNTIFDRGLGSASPEERAVEYEGIAQADAVVAVSQYTKNLIVTHYGIDPNKVYVVHNGVDAPSVDVLDAVSHLRSGGRKIVLYVGRITIQKGLEYLIRAVARAREFDPSIALVVAGGGDMFPAAVRDVLALGLSGNVLFTGWLDEREVARLYRSADLFVMPSVSEPFGLVALEAAIHGVPVLVSKQSGAREVMKNALVTDFWDVDDMANKIVACVRHAPLREALSRNGRRDATAASWQRAAEACKAYYEKLVQ